MDSFSFTPEIFLVLCVLFFVLIGLAPVIYVVEEQESLNVLRFYVSKMQLVAWRSLLVDPVSTLVETWEYKRAIFSRVSLWMLLSLAFPAGG